MDKLEQRSGDGLYYEDGKYPTDPKVIDKINELVEALNGITKLIDYADNERERNITN